jgi:hypothetical protein
MKFVKIGFAVFAVFACALLVFVATRPKMAHYESSLAMRAPPDAIVPLIENLKTFREWSPYTAYEPTAKATYSGPESGKGAHYAWDGEQVGSGTMTVSDVTPMRVTIDLKFTKPFAAENIATFSLVPENGMTKVTWAMDGENTTMGKIASLFMDMDEMMTKDFSAGLASLKTRVEASQR